MTNPLRPSDPVADQLLADSRADGLPFGWYEVDVVGVDRRILVGPGGLYVVVTRAASVIRADTGRQGPWDGLERRRGPSAAQATADLVSQLLSTLCNRDLTCMAVVLLEDHDDRFFARVDEVPVLHRRRFSAWLMERPVIHGTATVELIRERATSPRPLHSV